MILNKAEENLYNKCSCKAGLLKARQARPHDNELKPRTLQMAARPYQMDDTLRRTTRFGKGHLKVTDVTWKQVGVSSKTKATENKDKSHGARRRISTRKRRSGMSICRR